MFRPGALQLRAVRGLFVLGGALLLSALSAVAATYAEQVARLESELREAKPAPPFATVLKLSALLEAENPARAWTLAEQARARAATAAEQLRADLWIDYLLWRQGQHAEALSRAREGAARARALHDDDLLARALLVVASAQDRMAAFPAALETYRELLPLADKSPDRELRSQVYDMLGVTRMKVGDLDQSEAAFKQAKKLAEDSGNPLLVPPVIAHLGTIARERGDAERGRALIQESVDQRIRYGGDTRGIADQEINLGAIAEDASDWPTALVHFERAAALHAKLGFNLNRANAEQCLAGILTRIGRLDEAQAHLDLALQLVGPTGSQTILSRVYREFARLNETRGDYRAALDFARKQAAAEDAALGERSRQRLDELGARFDAERRQHEIVQLDQERRLQAAELVRVRWQRIALVAGAAALAMLLGVVGWRFRSERRLRLQTEVARIAAEEANRLKTRLLGIASHDLKGPLNSITHGADLIAREPANLKEVASMAGLIRDTARRTFALVRDLIDVAALESGGLRLQVAPVDVNPLVADVVAEHLPMAEHKRQPLTAAFAESAGVVVAAD
ncbi:MAG TPA: tetratricopeptide repeat protein, partial [Opitutus sp.]|nr:tetratricopeptide repeat protein [Opitutus sp.]